MYKIPLIVIYLFFHYLISAQAMAEPIISPMSIVANQTAITLSQNGLAILQYTVINNTNKLLAQISIDPAYGLPNGSAIAIQNNTCNSLAANAQCTFDLFITGNNQLPAQFILSPRVCAFNRLICSQAEAQYRVTVSVKKTEIALAAGVDYTTGNPLIVTSHDADHWTKVTSSFNVDSIFYGANCYGTLCIAAGGHYSLVNSPLLAISQDSDNWSTVDLSSLLPDGGVFNSATCTQNVCLAVGSSTVGNPIIVVGKNSWINATPQFADAAILNGISCAENFCVTAGQDNTLNQPLIFVNSNVNQNNGGNWTEASLTPTQGFLRSVSCSNNICIAVGQDTNSNQPIIFYTLNHSTWLQSDISSHSLTGSLNSVSCSDKLCVAVGGDDTLTPPNPYILVSKNNGITWTKVNLSTLTGTFISNSCSGSLCVAAGEDNSGAFPVPFIYVTQNSGTQWFAVDLSTMTTNAFLNSVSCAGSFCIVSGQDTPLSGAPLLIFSHNNGRTWQKANLSSISTSGAFFGSTVSFGWKAAYKRMGLH